MAGVHGQLVYQLTPGIPCLHSQHLPGVATVHMQFLLHSHQLTDTMYEKSAGQGRADGRVLLYATIMMRYPMGMDIYPTGYFILMLVRKMLTPSSCTANNQKRVF